MARKKRYQYEEDRNEDDFFISRSQKKRDSALLQEIGEEIVTLSQSKLDKLPLSEDLKQAITEHKRLSNKEAKRRQLQYIGRLMREAQEEFYINQSVVFKNEQDDFTPNTTNKPSENHLESQDLVSAYLEMKKNM